MKRHLTIQILVGLAFAAVALAQPPLTPRPPVVKPAKTHVDATKHDVERIHVKFRDDVPVRLRQGKLVVEGANANVLDAATGLFKRLATAGGKWERLHSVAEEKLGEMRDKAQRNTGKSMPDLNTAYVLRLPKGMKADPFIDELNALEAVEIAEAIPLPAPDPVVGNYQPEQGYLNVAPGGVDADYGWTQLAGTGGNVWIADIESNWNFNHTDINSPTLLGAASTLTAQINIDHGTAVLGVLASLDNGVGTTGIAFGSTLFVAARETAAGFNPAGAITTAMATLRPGDIMVLEMQTDGPAPGTNYVPIEWMSSVYDAVVVAVGNGIIVVEAAGNGSQNLDDPMFNTGHAPFLAANDSGAIIVGAGGTAAPGNGDRSRLDFSSFGSTVDLQGWGERVVTTGYGDRLSTDGQNNLYTATFGGTSSATPIVAGACAAIQAHYKATNSDAVLSPSEMRGILRTTGSPQLDGFTGRNGFYSQSGTTVTQQSGFFPFTSSDINSVIRFAGGQLAPITAILSTTQVTVSTSQTVATTTMALLRNADQNIGPRPNLRNALQFVSGPRVWVDFAWPVFFPELGTYLLPYNTVPEGVAAVPVDGSVIFKTGGSTWTGTISKGMILRSFGGATTIGQ